MKKSLVLCILMGFGFIMAGCARDISPDSYSARDIGQVSRVESGVVLAKRLVSIDNNSGAGGFAGTAAGAVAGTAIGGSDRASILGAVGGAVAGGVSAAGGGGREENIA